MPSRPPHGHHGRSVFGISLAALPGSTPVAKPKPRAGQQGSGAYRDFVRANLGKHKGNMKAVAAAYRAQKGGGDAHGQFMKATHSYCAQTGAGQVGGALPMQEEGEDEEAYALRVQEAAQAMGINRSRRPGESARRFILRLRRIASSYQMTNLLPAEPPPPPCTEAHIAFCRPCGAGPSTDHAACRSRHSYCPLLQTSSPSKNRWIGRLGLCPSQLRLPVDGSWF
jgi:hypothetical protein